MSDGNRTNNETVAEGNEEQHIYYAEDIQSFEDFDKFFMDDNAVLVM